MFVLQWSPEFCENTDYDDDNNRFLNLKKVTMVNIDDKLFVMHLLGVLWLKIRVMV